MNIESKLSVNFCDYEKLTNVTSRKSKKKEIGLHNLLDSRDTNIFNATVWLEGGEGVQEEDISCV